MYAFSLFTKVVKKNFSVSVRTCIAFGITLAVFSFVIAVMSVHCTVIWKEKQINDSSRCFAYIYLYCLFTMTGISKRELRVLKSPFLILLLWKSGRYWVEIGENCEKTFNSLKDKYYRRLSIIRNRPFGISIIQTLDSSKN